MIFWEVCALDIWRFIESTRAAAAASKSEAAVKTTLEVAAVAHKPLKRLPNIWHMPACGEARVPLLSAEPHLFTDMAFLRQPVMPIGEGRREGGGSSTVTPPPQCHMVC